MAMFGDFVLAKEVKKTIEKVAADKVEQLRPALKTAIVDSINTDDKYCMVTYVGESLSVRVPYNNVAPSFVGQYVRIGGPANDRRIEEVLGQTDSEDRLAQLEARCAQLEKKAYASAQLAADFGLTSGASVQLPLNTNDLILPYNMSISPAGDMQVQIPGDYRFTFDFQPSAHCNTVFDIYVAKIGSDFTGDIANRRIQVLLGSAEYNDEIPLSLTRLVYMPAGASLHVNIGTNASGAVAYKWGTKFTMELINPDPIVRPS